MEKKLNRENNQFEQKKVLLVLPTLKVGGMERAMSVLANDFVEMGVDTKFFFYGKKEHFYTIDNRISCDEPESLPKNKLLETLYNFHRYRNLCRLWKPDAVLSFGQNCNILTMMANLGTRNRLFISDRGNPNSYSKKWFERNVRRFCSRYLAGIIQQSQKAKEVAERELRCKNIAVIGNPITPLDRSLLDNAKRENIVVSVGRFIKTKNFDLLIRWFSELPTDWKLIILGSDYQYDNCKKLVKELGMVDRIILPGAVNNVRDYLLKSKIFAFTSTSEGFPNVVGEALAAGLPVVSFDCMAGPSEMITDGYNGYLVENFDKDSFCNRLMSLIDDEGLRMKMSENAIRSIDNFISLQISKKYISFLLK